MGNKTKAMKSTQISYILKPEKLNEHILLVQAVFRELHNLASIDMQYACFKTTDNTFVHIAQFGSEVAQKAFTELAAFRAFRKNLSDRILDKPVSEDILEIGHYSPTPG